ncbi:PA14 domain-containing protein, partial [Streptomyces sp. NPDC050698]
KQVYFSKSTNYDFSVNADDGVKLLVDGKTVIDVDSAEQSVFVFGSGRGETAGRDHGVGDLRPRALGCS